MNNIVNNIESARWMNQPNRLASFLMEQETTNAETLRALNLCAALVAVLMFAESLPLCACAVAWLAIAAKHIKK